MFSKYDLSSAHTKGESAYSRTTSPQPNRLLSFFYMTFNRLKYKRTADVDTLVFHGVSDPMYPAPSVSVVSSDSEDESSSHLWTYVELIDYSGDTQTMRQGDKFNALHMFSLVYHHNAYINYEVWEFQGKRPLVYLNISTIIISVYPSTNTLAIISSPTWTIIHKRGNTTTTL